MGEITAAMVKDLRERTGAGMMDCKKALAANDGDPERAVDYLREKGLAAAAKKTSRVTAEGIVESYIHGGGRIGVLIEVNCETDFVAKTDTFKQLVRDLAMQVAASRPEYLTKEDVAAEILEREQQVLAAQARNEGKPEKIVAKMVEGRISKFYEENCLWEQPFIKDPDQKVSQLVMDKIAQVGENITIRRFIRYEMGEGIEKRQFDLAAEVAAITSKECKE